MGLGQKYIFINISRQDVNTIVCLMNILSLLMIMIVVIAIKQAEPIG